MGAQVPASRLGSYARPAQPPAPTAAATHAPPTAAITSPRPGMALPQAAARRCPTFAAASPRQTPPCRPPPHRHTSVKMLAETAPSPLAAGQFVLPPSTHATRRRHCSSPVLHLGAFNQRVDGGGSPTRHARQGPDGTAACGAGVPVAPPASGGSRARLPTAGTPWPACPGGPVRPLLPSPVLAPTSHHLAAVSSEP